METQAKDINNPKYKLMFFRLEYNETQGAFHLEWLDGGYVYSPETHGWKTVCDRIGDSESRKFINAMMDKYPATDSQNEYRKKFKRPSIKVILAEYTKFMQSI